MPFDQSWLINRMQKLGYKTNEEGMCYGISHMGLQALLAGDYETFKKRIDLIEAIPVEEFAAKMTELNAKRLHIVEAVKQSLGPVRKLTGAEKFFLDEDKILSTYLNNVIRNVDQELQVLFYKGQLSAEHYQSELQRRIDTILFNAFTQKKISEALLNLSEKERLELDIPIFMEGVELYQLDSKHYSHLFDKNIQSIHNSTPSAEILFPTSLTIQDETKLINLATFSGVYDIVELEIYFETIMTAVTQSKLFDKKPIGLILSNACHTITVGFDPTKMQFIFIDGNQPIKYIYDAEVMAKEVAKAFFQNSITIFSTKIYATNKTQAEMVSFTEKWLLNPFIEKIHTITPQKCTATSHENLSWLFIAVETGNFTEVDMLLRQPDIDPNVALQDGRNPLFQAGIHENIALMQRLLAHPKTNPNLAMFNGINLLYLAAQNGQTEVVRVLLNHPRTDVNMDCNSATPLFIAAQKGHVEIVELLLSKKADFANSFKSNVESLKKFAASEKVVANMEALLKRKNYQDPICVSPLEIAEVMGHTEVVKLISEHELKMTRSMGLFSGSLTSQTQKHELEKTNNDPNIKNKRKKP